LQDLRCAQGFGSERTCQAPVAGCGACDGSDDCEGGAFCSGGYCEQELEGACDGSICCPEGATCRSSDGFSPPACLLPASQPGTYCDGDAACVPWLTCFSGECLVPDGGGCEASWECAGTAMTCMMRECHSLSGVGGTCVDADGNGPYDASCAAGLLCSAALVCIPPFSLGQGEVCNRDVECAAGLSCDSTHLCSF
jgi:hypothetical protein